MNNNHYIEYVNRYITNHTPVDFIIDDSKYYEIKRRLMSENISTIHFDIICASYTLFYTSMSYHKQASYDLEYQPYHILIGDYISSYIAEILYKNQLYEILKIFSFNTKQIMLGILNDNDDNNLLNNLVTTLKSR